MTDEIDRDETDEGEGEEEEAPKPKSPPRRVARRGNGAGVGAPAAVGVAPAGDKFQRSSNEADQVWNEITQWLPSQNLTPYDIAIQVRRVWPPGPSNEAINIGRPFGGEMVGGNQQEPPGSALYQFVMINVHMPTCPSAASYDIIFMRKSTGAVIATGRMPLPSAAECRTALQVGNAAMAANPGMGSPGPQPMYVPLPQAPPAPDRHAYPPPAPPHYPPSTQGFGQDAMMQELSYLRGALGEALNAAREGRQPNIPPPAPAGIAAPPEVSEDRIVAKVLMALHQVGVVPSAPVAPPPPVVAPPVGAAAVPPDSSLEGMLKRSVAGMTERIFQTAMGSVEKSITRSIGIAGLPPQEEEPEEATPPATVVAPENPEDMMPWKVGDVGSTWANGSPVKVALSKETGGLDLAGLAFANPAVTERLVDVATGLGAALQDLIKRVGTGPAAGVGRPPPPPVPQIVSQIPSSAIDANPSGGQPGGENGGGGWQMP